MRLPDTVIAIGRTKENTAPLFHELARANFSVFTETTWESVFTGGKVLLEALEQHRKFSQYTSSRAQATAFLIVDYTLPIWSMDAGLEFEFPCVIEGYLTNEDVHNLVLARIREVKARYLLVSPEEEAWLLANNLATSW